MRNVLPPYYVWSAWLYFSTWERLFLTALAGLSVYALFTAAVTVSSVRSNRAYIESIFLALRRRSLRLQRLIGTAFYLFGIVLFLSLQWAYATIDNSKTPGGWLVLQNFAIHFVFAFNVFIAFLVLHLLGGIVEIWVDKYGLYLKPQSH